MARCPELPFLPGFTFNPLIGRTKFNRDNQFENYGGIPMLIEKVKPNMFGPFTDRYPSAYARGEVVDLPGWIAFDKQILVFDAFFRQTLQEVALAPFQVRRVKIYFFLEDGTIQVIEPKVDNSGSAQGTLISRQRIRFPAPMDENFYDILDFNVGREVELYGKVFKVTDCDRFTRNFLNRIGISVPDPIPPPPDPYLTHREKTKITNLTKKPNIHVDTLGQFLANDGKVLRFYGYWDDRESENGILHDLEIHYYLADDTMEIKEIIPPNSGRDTGFMFMKRAKLPKVFKGLPGPGVDSNFTVLNVLGPGLGGRFITDALNCGKEVVHYYKENELTIGGIINCYGRRILLTDCDPYTKAYYRKKYGVDIFEPKPYPEDYIKAQCHKTIERELPPWNGYGSYEDSAVNCKSVELKAPHRDFQKFLKYDKVGLDSHILRFDARLVSKSKINCSRLFTISYYLSDDTIGVYETARDNSGFKSSQFFKRLPVQLPGQAIFTSKPPKNYTAQHMYVGAQLIINSFQFVLIDADEYALRFMEINAHEFPRSNIKLIMDKVREKLRPIYKDFVAENMPTESPTITYEKLRSKLCPIMGENFVEQEMITIARAFSASCKDPKYDRNAVRAIVLTNLKRALWDDLERTREYFLVKDGIKSGVLSRHDCYTLLRACRIPLDTSVLEKILDVAEKDQNCNIIYNDVLNFLDRNRCPMADIIPINVKKELWWASEREPYHGQLINWCAFNDYLDLQSLIKEASGPFLNKPKEDE
ncbi:EF-hand domain-containing family member C2-like [Onthophagus taurus]|uniref:EF-hand domain-containing family member C2-like n=1 Tax=Onthophagus taurus TaxID=166361 RepID=UPI000C20114D|nr:EF-hand domain-containing family member C2-like [Onthophagus taurus]